MWKPSFLTILYVQQNLKECVAWALLSKSADWVGCYAKYVTFKDTSLTELLHVVAEFHSTFLHGRNTSPRLMKKKKKKWVSMFDLHWRVSKCNEDKGWFLYQKVILTIAMRRRLQRKNSKNLKKSPKNSCETLLPSVFILSF